MSLYADRKYQRTSEIVSADMDGETVIMSLEANAYFGITGIGGRVWDMLEQPQTIDALVEHICLEFDVSRDICRRDVTLLLLDLEEYGLVQTV